MTAQRTIGTILSYFLCPVYFFSLWEGSFHALLLKSIFMRQEIEEIIPRNSYVQRRSWTTSDPSNFSSFYGHILNQKIGVMSDMVDPEPAMLTPQTWAEKIYFGHNTDETVPRL